MFIICAIVSIALAVMLVLSGLMKLRQHPQVVESIHGTVGVPLQYFPVLAGLEFAGATGLVIGLWLAPLGVLAGVGLVAYFVGAIIGHVRVSDTKGLAAPLVPLALSVLALVLRVSTM